MLSFGKLATGQADYYLEQAHGSLSRAQAASSGVEDYYLGGPEAPGVWAGAGDAALGLRGEVAGAQLACVLAGEHPATGAPLGRVLAARRPGFDVTFSAPKSVSVLFGIGDDLDTYAHVMAEQDGGERIGAQEQIVLARQALLADAGTGSDDQLAFAGFEE